MKGDSLDAAGECKRIKKNAFFDFVLRLGKEKAQLRKVGLLNWWPGAESNCRHADSLKLFFEIIFTKNILRILQAFIIHGKSFDDVLL